MRTIKRVLIGTFVLLITSLADPAVSYVLELGVKGNMDDFTIWRVGGFILFGTSNTDDAFTTCICQVKSKCDVTAEAIDDPTGTDLINVTRNATQSSNSGAIAHFVCSIDKQFFGSVMSCSKESNKIISCSTDQCSVNIKIICKKENVTLIWSSTQEARVYNTYRVNLDECCPVTQTTTTNLTTKTTTSTIIPTTQTSTEPFNNTNANEPTSPKEYTPTIQTTKSSITPPSTTPTNSTDSAPLKQDQQNGSTSSQITDVHIGIIVGTAVAAVLLTVIIMCVIWKIKTRSHNNPPNKSNGSKLGSPNQTISPNNAVRNETKTNKKNQQEQQPVSPQPVSNVNQEEYSEISQYYNPVDATQTVSPSNSDRNAPAEHPQNSAYSTALEIPEDTNPSVYSNLRENNVIPANVYNIGPNEQDATITNRANLTGASQDSGLNNTTIIKPVYSTIEHPNPGIKKTKKKEKRSIPVQYTEIDPTKKLNSGLNNYKPATGQQTANDQPSRDDQILPDKQTKPNNTYYDNHLPEPSQTLPNQQTKPNNNYFEIELPEPDHKTSDDEVTLSQLYTNAVYSPRDDMDVNNTSPMKETDKIYFNAV